MISRRRRGYLLLETTVAIGILVIAADMAIEIAHWSLKYMRSIEIADSRTAALDQAIGQLRHDVWCAQSMNATDAHTLTTNTNGTPITWRLESDSMITRTEAGIIRSWEAGGGEASFSVDLASVNLTFAESPDWRGGTISLTSELLLLRGRNQ